VKLPSLGVPTQALGTDRPLSQWFGLPQSVDVETTVFDLVRKQIVLDAVITEGSADLSVDFGDGVRLEVFNSSSGYEGWILDAPGGRFPVAQGGGRLVESKG
jgi:hypothetical protein